MTVREYILTQLIELEQKLEDTSGTLCNLAAITKDSDNDFLMHEFFQHFYLDFLELEGRVANICEHLKEAADDKKQNC